MKSIIADLIDLQNQPVAILQADEPPENALQFKEGHWGCSIAFLVAASKGKTAVFTKETATCFGSKTGLGFQDFPHGRIEYFLSCGNEQVQESEFYKKSPELARDFNDHLHRFDGKKHLVFKPLCDVTENETPLCITFLVDADQLSGLTGLAGYDNNSPEAVKWSFGSGCAQTVLFPMMEELEGKSSCYIGLTDPSARKCIPNGILSFCIPYHRFLEMEREAEGSFLTKATWKKVISRTNRKV